jgi:hypothetical protein
MTETSDYRDRAIALLKLGNSEADVIAALVAQGAPQQGAEALTRELAELRRQALIEARAPALWAPPGSDAASKDPHARDPRSSPGSRLWVVGGLVLLGGTYAVVSNQKKAAPDWGGYGSPAVQFAVEQAQRERAGERAGTTKDKQDELATCTGTEGSRSCVIFALTPHTKALLEKEHESQASVGVALAGDPTAETVRALGELPWLRRFSTIGGEKITDASAFVVLRDLQNLRVLSAGFPTLGPLGQLTKLQTLDLYAPTNLRDRDLSALAPLRELTGITVLGPGTKLEDISAVADLPALHAAGFSNLPVAAVAPLKRAAALRELYLEKPIVVDAKDFAVLGELTQLEELSITDEHKFGDFRFYAKLTALKRATVESAALKSVAPFTALPLEKLNLRKTAVLDVSPLTQVKTLRRFNVPEHADPKSVAALKKAHPDLEIVESEF